MTEPHPSRQDRQKALREDVRFRMLRALDTKTDLSQRGLARETGVSLGAVNALLNGLIEAGLVRIGSGDAPLDRFRISYVLADVGRTELRRLAARYLARRRTERAALDAEIAALQADFGPAAAGDVSHPQDAARTPASPRYRSTTAKPG